MEQNTVNGINFALQSKGIGYLAKQAGATLDAPFMPLTFMVLPVIPELIISDKIIFDESTFSFTSMFYS